MYIIALVRSIKKESLIPRLSYPIPNGEGFLRDFGTLINPIALAILSSGFLIQGRTRKPATHGGLPEGITDGNWRFRQYECVMIPRLCTMAWDG